MSEEEEIDQIIARCSARPISTTEEEREDRAWWAWTGMGILASEGYELTELDRQIDQLHINGQITWAEMQEILAIRTRIILR